MVAVVRLRTHFFIIHPSIASQLPALCYPFVEFSKSDKEVVPAP